MDLLVYRRGDVGKGAADIVTVIAETPRQSAKLLDVLKVVGVAAGVGVAAYAGYALYQYETKGKLPPLARKVVSR